MGLKMSRVRTQCAASASQEPGAVTTANSYLCGSSLTAPETLAWLPHHMTRWSITNVSNMVTIKLYF